MLDVVIIGSGYGGAVMAARLAPRARVLVVERGRRWRPGSFPSDVGGLVRCYRRREQPLGLWSMRLGDGTGNAFASGLGGGSLVNYGIAARPDDHVFASWPVPAHDLAPWYERALSALRPEHAPFAGELDDRAFLDLVEPGRRVDLRCTIDWSRCTRCGHCVPGCNAGAKRTLESTYLALAEAASAELLTETQATGLRPLEEGGYEVQLARTDCPGDRRAVRSRAVVLAAGTFGTLDLVHALPWLRVSPRFGQGMSMNGDALAFLYDTPRPVSGEDGAPLTTSVRLTCVVGGQPRTLTVMSGRVPASVSRFSAAALALVAGMAGQRSEAPRDDPPATRWRRRLRDLVRVGRGGALAHTFMFKLDGQDSARGTARFDREGQARMDWPDYAQDPILQCAAERLAAWAERVGGTVVPDVATLPGMRSFGVHPLGGCRMGRSVEDGVVDDRCRVFDPRGGVWPGLRIVDGSVVPSALGVPPSLTIAAIAERAAGDLAAELASRPGRQ